MAATAEALEAQDKVEKTSGRGERCLIVWGRLGIQLSWQKRRVASAARGGGANKQDEVLHKRPATRARLADQEQQFGRASRRESERRAPVVAWPR